MNDREINEGFSVAGQISPQDMTTFPAAGFRYVIRNRPDDEGRCQPLFAEIEAAANAAALEAAYVPATPGGMGERDVKHFAGLMRALPSPVLDYCRSGARAAGVWQAAQSLRLVG